MQIRWLVDQLSGSITQCNFCLTQAKEQGYQRHYPTLAHYEIAEGSLLHAHFPCVIAEAWYMFV